MDEQALIDVITEKVVQRFSDRIIKIEKDIDTLYKNNNVTIDRLARIETRQETLIKSVDTLIATVEALKDKPGERWNSVVNTGIGATLGIIAGFVGSKIFGGK